MSNLVLTNGIDFKILNMKVASAEGDKIYYMATVRSNTTQEEVKAFNRWGSWMFTDEEQTFMRDMNVGIAATLQEMMKKMQRERDKLAEMGWMA